MMKYKNRLAGLAFCLTASLLVFSQAAFAEVKIKLIAVNPLEDQEKEVQIKHYLPDEIEPNDVIDTGGLKIDYDVNRGAYFVHDKILFKPKESKSFTVRVQDVWTISPDEIDLMKNQLEKNLTLLDPEKDDIISAEEMSNDLSRQLDYILAQQTNYSENINRRIEQYRAYRADLESIRDRVYSVDFLRHDAKALLDMYGSASTVKLIIEVENPDKENPKTVTHKHLLPKEVRETHIIDSADFEVRYDEQKERAYLTKEEEFKPGESKRYEIVIRDIWRYPLIKVKDLDDRAQIATGELIGTVFEESGQFLSERIHSKLEEIRVAVETKPDDMPIKDHIGMFRTNEVRFDAAKRDFERIEEMISIVRAKKLEKLEAGKVKNVLQRLKALRGLSALSEALFKRGLSITVTWRIIFGTLIFVGGFTAAHFIIWSKRSKSMGEEKGGMVIQEVPKPGAGGEDEEDEEG